MNKRWHKVFIACHWACSSPQRTRMEAIAGRSPGTGRAPVSRRRGERCSLRRLRLRGTADLQAATDQRCRASLADPLEGVRSLDAVLNDAALVDCGCEGPQPSRPPPIKVAAARMGIAGRSPGGRRSLGAVLNDAALVDCGCEGPQPSRPPPIKVAAARMGIAGRSPGGRRSLGAVLNGNY